MYMGKMMRKNGPNKSELVRQYMQDHPEEGPTKIADAVSALHGIEVKPQFVSMIKLNLKNKAAKGESGVKRGRKPGRRPKAESAVAVGAGAPITLESLKAAKKFILQMGSAASAKAAVDLLAGLAD
jgi:hypothetical protein